MKIFVVACTVFFTLLNVPKSDGQESLPPEVLNIIVILDTSNRVSRELHPDQIERDIAIVAEIVTQFEKVVKANINKSNELAYQDSLEIVVPNQPTVLSPWKIVNTLKIEDPGELDNLEGPTGILEDLKRQKKTLSDGMSKLYEFVEQHPQTGSDIWEWFEYDAKDYIDEDKRNLIICLSDGYLNFNQNIEATRNEGTFMKISALRDDPTWRQKMRDGEGLKPIQDNLSSYDVKFLMLEIALRSDNSGFPYQNDFDIIKAYWDTWLGLMGIKDTDFIKRGHLPIRRIRSFISSQSRKG